MLLKMLHQVACLKPTSPFFDNRKALNHEIARKSRYTSSVRALSFKNIHGIRELAETQKYEAWFLDQFGVLHDGKNAYPGAVETVTKLYESGSKLILISNSSKRSQVTIEKLPSLGFDPSQFAAILTSGELTHLNLLKRADSLFSNLGNKCIHFTWSARGTISLDGLGLEVVERISDADFILAHGTEAQGLPDGSLSPKSLQDFENLLLEASRKEQPIPMVVANPDLVTVEVRNLRVMPGTLGKKYESFGGVVKWMGKPDPIIYKACEEIAGIKASNSVGVGDSLHHDILGSNLVGMDSVFVTGGIHAGELGIGEFGQIAEKGKLDELISKFSCLPNFVIPAFVW